MPDFEEHMLKLKIIQKIDLLRKSQLEETKQEIRNILMEDRKEYNEDTTE